MKPPSLRPRLNFETPSVPAPGLSFSEAFKGLHAPLSSSILPLKSRLFSNAASASFEPPVQSKSRHWAAWTMKSPASSKLQGALGSFQRLSSSEQLLFLKVALTVASALQSIRAWMGYKASLQASHHIELSHHEEGDFTPERAHFLKHIEEVVEAKLDWIDPFERDYLAFAFGTASGIIHGFEALWLAIGLRARAREPR